MIQPPFALGLRSSSAVLGYLCRRRSYFSRYDPSRNRLKSADVGDDGKKIQRRRIVIPSEVGPPRPVLWRELNGYPDRLNGVSDHADDAAEDEDDEDHTQRQSHASSTYSLSSTCPEYRSVGEHLHATTAFIIVIIIVVRLLLTQSVASCGSVSVTPVADRVEVLFYVRLLDI